MNLVTQTGRFLREYVFSLRIFWLNLPNLGFWILVSAACRMGIERGMAQHNWVIGSVGGMIGLVLGGIAGTLFLGLFYVISQIDAERRSSRRQKITDGRS